MISWTGVACDDCGVSVAIELKVCSIAAEVVTICEVVGDGGALLEVQVDSGPCGVTTKPMDTSSWEVDSCADTSSEGRNVELGR